MTKLGRCTVVSSRAIKPNNVPIMTILFASLDETIQTFCIFKLQHSIYICCFYPSAALQSVSSVSWFLFCNLSPVCFLQWIHFVCLFVIFVLFSISMSIPVLQFYISLVIQMLKFCLAHFELSIHVHQKKKRKTKKKRTSVSPHETKPQESGVQVNIYKHTFSIMFSIVKRGTLNKKAKNTTLIASL